MSHKTNMLPKIIAITGAKRSGKDLLANYLCNKYLYDKIAFADPLKNAVRTLFNFTNDQIGFKGDGELKDIIDNRWGITQRQALQFFGTEILQYKIQELLPNINRKFLANALVTHVQNNNDVNFVISDLRFIHEYEELKKLGAFVIRIDRTNITQSTDVHCSEMEYKNIPCDMYIINDKDISSFIKKFDIAFDSITK